MNTKSKSGGAAPYGYRRTEDAFELDPLEAPIRTLIFELFLTHKRKLTVASTLNQKGYRTRSGAKFSDSSVDRFLRDPIVTGHHKDNFMPAHGGRKFKKLKPEEEWRFPPIAPLIDETTWNQAQDILCSCKAKMHNPHGRKSYFCTKCDNAIEAATLESISQEKIRAIPVDAGQSTLTLAQQETIDNHPPQVATLTQEKEVLEKKINKLYDLYVEAQSQKPDLARNTNLLKIGGWKLSLLFHTQNNPVQLRTQKKFH